MHSLKPEQYRRLAVNYRQSAEAQPVGTRERTLAHALRLETLANEVEELGLQALTEELALLQSKHKLVVFAARLGIDVEDEVIERDREDLRSEIVRRLLVSRPNSRFLTESSAASEESQ